MIDVYSLDNTVKAIIFENGNEIKEIEILKPVSSISSLMSTLVIEKVNETEFILSMNLNGGEYEKVYFSVVNPLQSSSSEEVLFFEKMSIGRKQ